MSGEVRVGQKVTLGEVQERFEGWRKRRRRLEPPPTILLVSSGILVAPAPSQAQRVKVDLLYMRMRPASRNLAVGGRKRL